MLDIKFYLDVIYYNYYDLGLSLCFLLEKGLDLVDIFNCDFNLLVFKLGRMVIVYVFLLEVIIYFIFIILMFFFWDFKFKLIELLESIVRLFFIMFMFIMMGR